MAGKQHWGKGPEAPGHGHGHGHGGGHGAKKQKRQVDPNAPLPVVTSVHDFSDPPWVGLGRCLRHANINEGFFLHYLSLVRSFRSVLSLGLSLHSSALDSFHKNQIPCIVHLLVCFFHPSNVRLGVNEKTRKAGHKRSIALLLIILQCFFTRVYFVSFRSDA